MLNIGLDSRRIRRITRYSCVGYSQSREGPAAMQPCQGLESSRWLVVYTLRSAMQPFGWVNHLQMVRLYHPHGNDQWRPDVRDHGMTPRSGTSDHTSSTLMVPAYQTGTCGHEVRVAFFDVAADAVSRGADRQKAPVKHSIGDDNERSIQGAAPQPHRNQKREEFLAVGACATRRPGVPMDAARIALMPLRHIQRGRGTASLPPVAALPTE